MSLVSWIRQVASPRQIAAWAAEVAQNAQADVAVRLGQSVYRMSLPAARGYIRARSASVLDQEMLALRQQIRCSPTVALAVQRQAMDEIIRMAMGDLLKTTHKVPLRRAA